MRLIKPILDDATGMTTSEIIEKYGEIYAFKHIGSRTFVVLGTVEVDVDG